MTAQDRFLARMEKRKGWGKAFSLTMSSQPQARLINEKKEGVMGCKLPKKPAKKTGKK